MKRNKFAAGALALALGLGAVAPSFADDGTYYTDILPKSVEEKVVVDGTTFTKVRFQETLKEANKAYNEYKAAKADADNLEEALEIAKDRYQKAYEAYRKHEVVLTDIDAVDSNGDDIDVEKVTAKIKSNYQRNLDIALEDLNNKISEDEGWTYGVSESNIYRDAEGKIVIGNSQAKGNIEDRIEQKEGLLPGEVEQAIDLSLIHI